MPIERTQEIPADGQWHRLQDDGPVLSIEAPLSVEIDIDREGNGWGRVIRGTLPVVISYTLGEIT